MRPPTIIGAPSNIGIKPYDSGELRGLDQAPAVLRGLGLARMINATDDGDVTPPAYRDFTRTPGRARNETGLVEYTGELADRIAAAVSKERFALVLGGDCSIVLAGLLGLHRAGRRNIGLAYIDGHADFATPVESLTGSAASMCLSLAVGRGDTPLARLAGAAPLVDAENVALVGRRDEAEPWYGHDALHASAVLDLPHAEIGRNGYGAADTNNVFPGTPVHFTASTENGAPFRVEEWFWAPSELPAAADSGAARQTVCGTEPTCTYGPETDGIMYSRATVNGLLEQAGEQIAVEEIQLVVECDPAEVVRGATIKCTATTRPEGTDFTVEQWKFTDGAVIITETTSRRSWTGPLVVDGTVTVEARLDGAAEAATTAVSVTR